MSMIDVAIGNAGDEGPINLYRVDHVEFLHPGERRAPGAEVVDYQGNTQLGQRSEHAERIAQAFDHYVLRDLQRELTRRDPRPPDGGGNLVGEVPVEQLALGDVDADGQVPHAGATMVPDGLLSQRLSQYRLAEAAQPP